MSNGPHTNRNSWYFLVLTFLAGLICFYLSLRWENIALLREVLRDLGSACAVSFILCLSIERWNKRIIREEFKQIASEITAEAAQKTVGLLAGRNIPEKLSDTVFERLKSTIFVRSHLTAKISLEPIPSNPRDFTHGSLPQAFLPTAIECLCKHLHLSNVSELDRSKYVLMRTKATYDVQNLSVNSQQHSLSFSPDKLFPSVLTDLCTVVFTVGGNKLEPVPTIQEDENAAYYEARHKVEGRSSVAVCVEACTIKAILDDEHWAFGAPSEGAEFIVEDHTGLLQCNITFSHSDFSKTREPGKTASLVIRDWILKRESVRISWFPSKKVGS